MVKQLSGAATIKEAMGWLDAKALALKDANKTAARVARLEKSHTADKIAKMIADGKAAHKITPGNEKRVREGAAEHGVKWLKAFLGATDPVISTREHSPDTDLALPKGVKATADQVKIWKKMGFNAEKIAELSAQYDQEIADMNSRTQNGALKGSN
jgi:phage I-like protein